MGSPSMSARVSALVSDLAWARALVQGWVRELDQGSGLVWDPASERESALELGQVSARELEEALGRVLAELLAMQSELSSALESELK